MDLETIAITLADLHRQAVALRAAVSQIDDHVIMLPIGPGAQDKLPRATVRALGSLHDVVNALNEARCNARVLADRPHAEPRP